MEFYLAYAGLWALFGASHSVMASETFKIRWRRLLGPLARAERLFFNLFALLFFWQVHGYGLRNLPHNPVFLPEGALQWVLWGIQGLAVFFLLWALSEYDLPRFAGIKNLVAGELGPEPLLVDGLHRHIRHPLYAPLLVILWTRPMDTATLATNFCATIYLFIGTWFEEKRLSALYGAAYDDYRKRVPGFIPRWR